jgi:L-asparaginase
VTTPEKPRIAVFSGPTATIQNSPPLVTSNKARAAHGLPLIADPDGAPARFDTLRAQRLAAPVTVYIDAMSAHPLEADAAELYAPPDGYVDAAGAFHERATSPADRPVYRALLEPSDGLYLLPYMARQASGAAWDDATAFPLAPAEQSRQTFYPNAHRIYEEIDRFGLDSTGKGNLLSSVATYDFYRPAPSGGYKHGLPEAQRTDTGAGDIAPETLGEDFFIYYPRHLRAEPHMSSLARATNVVQRALATGKYTGAQWLEGSPTTEESMYWLNLLIDTKVPLVGHSAQRPHQTVSADGDHNIVDGVKYILSGIWKNGGEADIVGGVMIVDEVVFSAREVTKTDARPGNYQATGGHGGIVALMGGYGPPQLTYVPTKRHTASSEVNLTRIPSTVDGVRATDAGIRAAPVPVKSGDGDLLPDAMPKVTIAKYARYMPDSSDASPELEVEVMSRIARNLEHAPLAGFVGEGASPYGSMNRGTDNALMRAVFSGMPVVRCGRGSTGGLASKTDPVLIAGSNLTSTKARMLLMASLLRFGALPPARDPASPTPDEIAATAAKVAQYQAVFDSH